MNKLAVIDLFCGAGGTTTGIEKAKLKGRKIAKVIACVNHDPMAIASHKANHSDVLHFTEDIRTLNILPIINLANKYRDKGYKILLWASLECTNFSNAKGGKPRDADSRTLAEHLPRYIDGLSPDFIMNENVVEFMSWGPLNDKGKPVSKMAGSDYIKWANAIQNKGYHYDYRIMNSADFGAYTSRKRYFGVFYKHGLTYSFPSPTHSRNCSGSLFEPLKKWKPVKDKLNLMDEGISIFGRKKKLSENTLARIYAGLEKYVYKGESQFIKKDYGVTNFIASYYGNTTLSDVNCPAPTITTKDRFAKISANHQSINVPAGTIVSNDKHSLVTAKWVINTNFSNKGSSIESPAPVITANRKHHYLASAFLINQNSSTSPANSLELPSPTITVARTHYIVNPGWFGNVSSIEKPCVTIIARQDKSPLYLITAETGDFKIPVYDEDCEWTIKIKEFMAAKNLVDIKMRMLTIDELKAIQGFPKDYILKGTKTDQKKFIGNSVVPVMSKVLIQQAYISNYQELEKTA